MMDDIVKAFRKANRKSPVVQSFLSEGGGRQYVLEDGQRFRLTAEQMHQAGVPRVGGPEEVRNAIVASHHRLARKPEAAPAAKVTEA